MPSDPQRDWRDCIRAYLDAAWEDQRRRHAADLSGCEALCLKELASESVWREHQQLIQRRIEKMERPPPETAYEVVEESAERAIAQVIPGVGSVSIPWVTTRFVLQNSRESWKIIEIWQACISCNPVAMPKCQREDSNDPRRPGRCPACGGCGRFTVPKTVGLWIFRHQVSALGECSFCHGKGTCMQCEKWEQPGWRSAFTTEWFASDQAADA